MSTFWINLCERSSSIFAVVEFCVFFCMNRASRSVVALCAGVSPVSAKTVNGRVILATTKCVKADLKGANLRDANLTSVTWANTTCPDGSVIITSC